MTNFGFLGAMEAAGIEVEQTNVGDRYVLEAILKHEWNLGGEQSGHIIWTDFTRQGDRIAASLLTLGARREAPRGGGAVRAASLSFSRTFASPTGARSRGQASVERCGGGELEAGGRDACSCRPSGTEPLVRVMVEAPSEEECEAICGRLVAVVGTELGWPTTLTSLKCAA